MSIKEKLQQIRATIPSHIELVCVSKFHPVESIEEAYACGERIFGENRPQEMAQKAVQLPADIKWQFIGNLQTNKVKIVVPYADLIQSVSNERLFDEIEKVAAKIDKVQKVLIELHVADEESKQGFTPEEAKALLTTDFLSSHPHITICGVMGMATNTDNQEQVRNEFRQLHTTFEQLRDGIFKDMPQFKELSMGMSGDYQIAISEGCTTVRIGSSIFGARQY